MIGVRRREGFHNGRVVVLTGTCRVLFLLLMSMPVKVSMQKIAEMISTPSRGKFEHTCEQTSFRTGRILTFGRNLQDVSLLFQILGEIRFS
jgi:hypothetical protein